MKYRGRLAVSLILVSAQGVSIMAADRVTGRSFATRSEVIATHGMVCTSQPLATQVGLDILKAGGSAVDAAIAANAMLCLTEPTGCGLGGDLFAIVWDAKQQKLLGLNASGRSPASLTLQHFRDRSLARIPKRGPLPVSVPGCVDGWAELHGRFGRLRLGDILAPTIRYAREGFPVSEVIAHYWAQNSELLRDYDGFATQFLIDGRAPAKGELFQNQNLARTLEQIASGGRDAFYRGDIARTIDAYMKRQGGFLGYDDLAAHHSDWVAPVSTNYRGYDVFELPPNGQGIAALQMLNVLEGYDLRSLGFGSREYIHLFVEAKKLAFEDRARLYADPDFCRMPIAGLISKDYAAQRRALIDPDQAATAFDAGNPALRDGDTIYLTTADQGGNMVSLIQSNYRGMGSGMCPDGLGFILQNRGELFDLTEGRNNTYAPRKRPFHTIIPAFVLKDGAPFLSFGVMGGATQPQGHVQILCNIIDFGMNAQEAGDAPRILHEGSSEPTGETMTDGGTVALEAGFAPEVVRDLTGMGHRIVVSIGQFGGYQGILVDQDRHVYFGASESRKDGCAAGY